jgi:hypothetical protein
VRVWTGSSGVDGRLLRGCSAQRERHTRFGCFSFELLAPGDVLRIHFSNRDSAGDCGPLVRAKADRRVEELREMFGYIRTHHQSTRTVRGGSWLYNLEAYRRLFPPEYDTRRPFSNRSGFASMERRAGASYSTSEGSLNLSSGGPCSTTSDTWTPPRRGRPFQCGPWERRARSIDSIGSTAARRFAKAA